jgi:hypothetical protein
MLVMNLQCCGAIADAGHRSAASSQSASLRALHTVRQLLVKNNPLSALLSCNINDLSTAESDEIAWLKGNSLQQYVFVQMS